MKQANKKSTEPAQENPRMPLTRRNYIILAVGFLRHVFQGGDRNGEQLHNDGSVDIRRHT